MTVHARGYRPYTGPRGRVPAALAIAREGIRIAWSRRAFRLIGILYLGWFAMLLFFVYLTMGTDAFDFLARLTRKVPGIENPSLMLLNTVLQVFYTVLAYLTALLAIFVGSPLVADDVQAGALPLYLVRPIRAVDYVVGKALVIPVLLAFTLLVPGVFFYVIVGAWQPPGETLTFLTANLDVLGRVLWHFLVSAAAYTGLALLLSARTSRRGVAAAVAGTILFAGVMMNGALHGSAVTGFLADAFRHANLPRDTVTVLLPHSWTYVGARHPLPLPSTEVVVGLASALFAAGLVAVWRRARSVEVTG